MLEIFYTMIQQAKGLDFSPYNLNNLNILNFKNYITN